MRRIQMRKGSIRRDDPNPELSLDPRDPDILRAKRLRRATDAGKQSR